MKGSYFILGSTRLETLCEAVMDAQSKGWEPLGGVAVCSVHEVECWYQAITHKKAFTREEIRKTLFV